MYRFETHNLSSLIFSACLILVRCYSNHMMLVASSFSQLFVEKVLSSMALQSKVWSGIEAHKLFFSNFS
jgi:hypothetical protein